MKRFLILALAVLTVLPLVSCSTPIGPSTSDTTTAGDTEETTAAGCQHQFSTASCIVPATCALCGEVQGERARHTYADATCLEPSRCTVCGKEKTNGGSLGHMYAKGECVRCADPDPLSAKAEGITRIAFVGDSITKGGYWAKVKNTLGTSGYEYQGYGVSGSTAYSLGYDGEDLDPKAYIDQPEYEQSMRCNPDIVVIMLGTNDSKSINTEYRNGIRADGGERFKSDVIALIKGYQELQDSPTVFLALPPVSFRAENGGISNVNIEELIIPLLLSAAQETGAIVIDTHTATKGESDCFPDGVHPNSDGQALLAETVAQAILNQKNS